MKQYGIKFNRSEYLHQVGKGEVWDVIVIGGGATGLGTALDSALRGYKTLLLEQDDFAKGTSSRSTKLVHGGVRYLAQGNIGLVYEALQERSLLFKNAPHLVKEQEFIIPCYGLKTKYLYLIGLKIYDLLAGDKGFRRSSFLSAKQVAEAIPGVETKKLIGGVRYSDGQFDDARLAINLAQTCAENDGVLLNYMKVVELIKTDGKISGVKATDQETNTNYTFNSRVVVNATGVFVDEILQMDMPATRPIVRPSQGVHVVLDRSFLGGDSALMIPQTDDGRVLFAVPWHNKVLVGTTDTPLNEHRLEPVALAQEIDFILDTTARFLKKAPARTDVLSVFAGLRPLAAPGKDTDSTKEISRSHKLIVNASGLITITGGKWTTYRKMAQEVVNKASVVGNLPYAKCVSKEKAIHGSTGYLSSGTLTVYGSDACKIEELAKTEPALREVLLDGYSFIKAEVVWAVRNEMAIKVEDVLARRLRILFLDAKAAILMAPTVAAIIAAELNYTDDWKTRQIEEFTKLANQYLLQPYYPALQSDVNKKIAV